MPTVISPAVPGPDRRDRYANLPVLSGAAEANILAYRREYGDQGGARFNDLPTVAYVVDPTLFRSERVRVEIETAGTLTSGMTVVDWRGQYGRPPNTELLLDVEAARLVDMFAERLTAPVVPA